jgi:hypothetical protein
MFRVLFAVLRSRIVWIGVGAVTVAGVAFVFTVAVTAAVVIALRGRDVDPHEFAEMAVSLGLAAAVAAIAAVVAAWRALCRARARRWLPLYQAMVHEATSAPATYLVEIVTSHDRAAGSHVVAADLHTGELGPLWLPGTALPRGTVVCLTQTPTGTQVRSWMSRTLWRPVRARRRASPSALPAPNANAATSRRNTYDSSLTRRWPQWSSTCENTVDVDAVSAPDAATPAAAHCSRVPRDRVSARVGFAGRLERAARAG